MVIVILHYRQSLFDRGAGNANHTNTVVNQAVRYLNRSLPGVEFRDDSPVAESGNPFGTRIRPEKLPLIASLNLLGGGVNRGDMHLSEEESSYDGGRRQDRIEPGDIAGL